MRIAFVAALATAVQAISVAPVPEPYELSAIDVDAETEAELEADVEAKLEAFVEAVCTSTVASNAQAFADAEMDVKTLKDKVVGHLKNFAKDSELSMSGIMTAVGDIAKTAVTVGGAIAAPSPVTIGLAAKQLWDDYQHAKGAFKTWKTNRDKRLGKK